jgi:hypothetical protein
MMRQSETMRAASRLLLSHPIVCLLAVFSAGVVLGVLGPIKVVHATDVEPVEAENFDNKPTGTSVVTNTTLYQNGQALRFNNNTAIAWEDVDLTSSTSSHDVELVARAGQSGGSPKLRVGVNGTFTAPAQAITNKGAPQPYTFNVNAPLGSLVRISVKASNTGTGRKPFVDYVTFPPSGGGGTLTDTDGDGVPDSTDQCDTQPGPASNNGCPLPTPDLTYIGSATGDTGTTPQVKVTVPVPPGTKQGDFMLALLQADYGNVGGTLPSGWTLINEHLEGRDLSLHAYYKIAAATEPPSYTWNVVNAALHPLAGGTILTFRGVDQASPVFANAVNPETADPAKIDCPSVNAPNGGILVCGFTHDDPQPDIKAPAGMTRVSNFIIRNDDAHAVAYEPIAKAGATGLRSATINPNLKGGKNDISMAISLRPSAVNSSIAPTTAERRR